MQTPEHPPNSTEPGPSDDKGKLKRWQFSLRSLMIVTVGVALFLGLTQTRTRLYEPVFQVCSLGLFFFQNYLLMFLAVRNRRPDRWMLLRSLGASLLPAVFLVLRGEPWHAPYHSWFVVLMLASLFCWPGLGVIAWLVRSASSSQDWQALRRQSLVHLFVETACLACVCLAALRHEKRIGWFGAGGLLLLAVLANLIPLILWLSLFSPWRNVPTRGWPDSLFRWSIAVALGIAICSCLYGVYLANNREYLDEYYHSPGALNLGLGHEIRMGIFFWLPQTACAVMFALGVICQLFRAHQDRWLIALGCVYFVPFWLVLLVAPRLLH